MNKVLVIGSLNTDMVVSVERIPMIGETTLASYVEKHNGGKGANQAVACSRFGAKTYMIGAIGNDEDGKALQQSLKNDDIDITGIKIDQNQKTGMAWITVDKNADNSIVVIPGANGSITKEDIEANEGLFNEVGIILLQLEIPIETVEYAINKGKEKGCTIILNPAPAIELSPSILSKIDIITPNKSELDTLTKDIVAEDSYKKALELIKFGVGNVICTLGENGALLVNKNGKIEFPGLTVDAIDTTGAGDCFNGVLAAEIANGNSVEEAIEYAIKASAISVTRKGAQSSMPKRQDVLGNYKFLGGI
ncbi:ribokinase [Tissierella sp. MB52-C2]|uniref:ribokinase n=1 Tax=Tissierella sp. MB52-C2 TaxID=3070999 RepID=UPI00280A9174|nr:ribokinase [Tissierella sp. MB52-C2]WMM24573.1 ribokinase [Tissierella sp. MB52-C2]